MKSYFGFIFLYFALSLLSCQDTKDDVKGPHADYEFYKTIGEQIPFETGMRWIEAHRANNRDGRVAGLQCKIAASQLVTLMQSVPNLTGIAFHYGEDGEGNTHILVIPMDESLSVWSTFPGKIIVDANTSTEISQSTAEAWAQSYKISHPFGIWFHFFGRNIFDEIVAIPYFSNLDIQPALNDVNLLPQMLLIVWNADITAGGRTSEESGTVYDASNPCPPCPPLN